MTYKTYPDVEQSKRLAGILPIESADGYWCKSSLSSYKVYTKDTPNPNSGERIPCWSLAALLAIIPIEHSLHGYLTEKGMVYRVETLYARNSKSCDNPVDACVDMIVKLHEQNLLLFKFGK